MVCSDGEDLGEEEDVKRSNWKSIDEDDGSTQRMTVPGGHLYRTIGASEGHVSVAMTFVPTMKKSGTRSHFVLRKRKKVMM